MKAVDLRIQILDYETDTHLSDRLSERCLYDKVMYTGG